MANPDFCDVAAAFDHVSHHEIIKATMDMGVPPILIAAWIREYRYSETVLHLDDVVTPGIRRTRSVPQGDPCAADLFGAALERPAGNFMEMCQKMKSAYRCDGEDTWDCCSSQTTAGYSGCQLPNYRRWRENCVNY